MRLMASYDMMEQSETQNQWASTFEAMAFISFLHVSLIRARNVRRLGRSDGARSATCP
jgi:hypothetical protein